MKRLSNIKGFTLIELLVVIAIISLLSSVVFASMTSVRKKARDSQRIQNARQIATALELYEQTYSTYKVTGSGLSSNPGTGYVTKTGGTYSGTSILSTLEQSGFLKTDNLKDPIFADNYYIGLCTSTNAYNVFVKLEQDQYNQATSSIINTCGGTLASNEGFSFIGATTGGTSGGGAGSIAGSYEAGMIPSGGGGGSSFVSSIGSLDINFDVGAGANNYVASSATQSDGKVIIGGSFTSYNGTSINRIARLNSDGSLDSSFNVGSGAGSGVYTITIQPDGKILIGGDFTSYNGTSINRLARLNSDGSLDSSFNVGSGLGSLLRAAAIQADGKILIIGNFTSYNGTSINRIARLNSDGSLDSSFNVGSGADNYVYTTTIQSDGKIIIGGWFTTYGGISRNRIARLNSDGSLDSSFNVGSGASNNVFSTAIQPDGKIIIGGGFTLYDGSARVRLARLNSDGSLDSSFNVGLGTNDVVHTIAIQPDGKLIIGGWFVTFNGTARSRIARLNSDGSLDNTFNPGSGANGNVDKVSIQPDGKIIIVGSFNLYNGTARSRLARLF